jgi:hypothetical protein
MKIKVIRQRQRQRKRIAQQLKHLRTLPVGVFKGIYNYKKEEIRKIVSLAKNYPKIKEV